MGRHVAEHHDGQTGKVTVIAQADSAERAREIANAERANLTLGSSDWYEVHER